MSENATKEDLLKLELKMDKSSTKERHEIKWLIQKYVISNDDNKTDQALIKQTQNSMKENIKEIKQDIKEWFKDIKKSFEKLPEHFATKAEHKENQKTIAWIIKILWTFGCTIIVAWGSFIWHEITSVINK